MLQSRVNIAILCGCGFDIEVFIALKGQIIYSNSRTCLGKICNIVNESPRLCPNVSSHIKENITSFETNCSSKRLVGLYVSWTSMKWLSSNLLLAMLILANLEAPWHLRRDLCRPQSIAMCPRRA